MGWRWRCRRVPARAIYSATSGEQSAWAATLEESVRGSQWAAERELSPPRSIVASHAAARGDGWPERSELRVRAPPSPSLLPWHWASVGPERSVRLLAKPAQRS